MKNVSYLLFVVISFFCLLCSSAAHAGVGTEAASFLDIPVGARPAALGDAYAALATDAYAMTSNPGGLAFLDNTEVAAQHLAYLESIDYEYLSFVHPFHSGSSAGASIQYLGSGNITQTAPVTGDVTGQYSTYYAAYSAAYSHTVGERLGIGVTAKMIDANISNVSAHAYAADVGAFYRARPDLNIAAVVTNMGTPLTFLQDGGALPLAGKVGVSYTPNTRCMISVQGEYEDTGLMSEHIGVEWKPIEAIALRAGYRTDTTKELGAMAGLSTGFGIIMWGQELSYAWLPDGDLGNTQYISFLARFGQTEKEKRNLIHYQALKLHRHAGDSVIEPSDPEYEQLMQLLSDENTELYTRRPDDGGPTP